MPFSEATADATVLDRESGELVPVASGSGPTYAIGSSEESANAGFFS